MIPYLILILLIALYGLLLQPSAGRQRRKMFLWGSFFLMLILSCLRDVSVGADTETYTTIFKYIDVYNFETSRYEKGFLYFLKIIHSVSDNPTFLFFVVSFICIGTVCLVVNKYSNSPLLSILLYITLKHYYFQMTGMRQALAMAFIELAFLNVDKEQTKRSVIRAILLILLACSIHNMSIVAVIPFLLFIWPGTYWKKLQFPMHVLRITIIASFVCFVFYGLSMRVVGLVVPQYASYFSGTWSGSNYSAALFRMLIQFVFIFVGALYLKNYELDKADTFFLIMMALSVITGTLSMKMTIWGRLTSTFSIYTALWVPVFTSVPMKENSRIILKGSIFLFAMMYMIITFIYRPEWDGVVPYLLMK